MAFWAFVWGVSVVMYISGVEWAVIPAAILFVPVVLGGNRKP
jgi:hypothetical protein